MKTRITTLMATALYAAMFTPAVRAQGTAFTYQGSLNENGAPASGSYSLRFILFNAEFAGSQVGPTLTNEPVSVAKGLFTTTLDFGASVFTGADRWLDIGVRTNGSGAFTTLAPRQKLTPTPYAITAVNLAGVVANNTVGAPYATVGGGYQNNSSGLYATVSGGYLNTAGDNFATVGGGYGNTASGRYATVGGGEGNTASDFQATVGGGIGNTASGTYATVSGGYGNTASGLYAMVGGGRGNTASYTYAIVSGGYGNTAGGESATVGGGYLNTASGRYATVPGGVLNSASGDFSYAAGYSNSAAGDYSFAAGRRARANHNGAFVWADSTDANFTSTAIDQFLIRAAGGVGIGNNNPQAPLHVNGGGDAGLASGGNIISGQVSGQNLVIDNNEIISRNNGAASDLILNLGSGNVGIGRTPTANRVEVGGDASKTTAGNWLANSDARIKTDVQTVTGALDKISRVRLVQFRYTDDYRAAHPGIADREYLNVLAQEFQKVFPEDVKHSGEKLANGDDILQVDTYPLTIYSAAAVQELNQKLTEELKRRDAENAELKDRLAALEKIIRHQKSNSH